MEPKDNETIDDKLDKAVHSIERNAKIGNIRAMNFFIDIIKAYPVKTCEGMEDKIAALEKVGYETALPLQIEAAERHAEKGHIRGMESSLERLTEYASWLKVDVSAQVFEVKTLGYTTIINSVLEDVKKYKEAHPDLRDASLALAIKYADKLRQVLKERLQEYQPKE